MDYLERTTGITQELINFIFRPQFTGNLLLLEIIFIIVSIVLVIMISYFIYATPWIKYRFLYDLMEFMTARPYGAKKVKGSWQRIVERLETNDEAEYKLALIEADEMLNIILNKMGYAGISLGERLKQLTNATLPNIEEIKRAHQIRNNIIQDPDYQINLETTKEILTIYEQAFRELDVI